MKRLIHVDSPGDFSTLDPDLQALVFRTLELASSTVPPRSGVFPEAVIEAYGAIQQLLHQSRNGRFEPADLALLQQRIEAAGGEIAPALRASGPGSLEALRTGWFGRLGEALAPPVVAVAERLLAVQLQRLAPRSLEELLGGIDTALRPLIQGPSPFLQLTSGRQQAVLSRLAAVLPNRAEPSSPMFNALVEAALAEQNLLTATAAGGFEPGLLRAWEQGQASVGAAEVPLLLFEHLNGAYGLALLEASLELVRSQLQLQPPATVTALRERIEALLEPLLQPLSVPAFQQLSPPDQIEVVRLLRQLLPRWQGTEAQGFGLAVGAVHGERLLLEEAASGVLRPELVLELLGLLGRIGSFHGSITGAGQALPLVERLAGLLTRLLERWPGEVGAAALAALEVKLTLRQTVQLAELVEEVAVFLQPLVGECLVKPLELHYPASEGPLFRSSVSLGNASSPAMQTTPPLAPSSSPPVAPEAFAEPEPVPEPVPELVPVPESLTAEPDPLAGGWMPGTMAFKLEPVLGPPMQLPVELLDRITGLANGQERISQQLEAQTLQIATLTARDPRPDLDSMTALLSSEAERFETQILELRQELRVELRQELREDRESHSRDLQVHLEAMEARIVTAVLTAVEQNPPVPAEPSAASLPAQASFALNTTAPAPALSPAPIAVLEGDAQAPLAAVLGDQLRELMDPKHPLSGFLQRLGLLRQVGRNLLLQRLAEAVVLEPEQEDRLLHELWQGRPEPQPLQADGAWLEGIPLADQPGLRQRWQDLRLRLWLENHYAQALEVRFEQRRAALDRVVLSLIRLDSHEVAEELYLRLLDDGADFGQLAREYSLGEERHTCGLIGPVPIGQLHQELQRLITTLAAGVVHPPLPVDGLVVLVKLEQRLPAEMGGNLRQQLLEELFEADLEVTLEAFLPSDQAADAPRELPAGGAA